MSGPPLPSGEGRGEGKLERVPNSEGRRLPWFPSPRPSPEGRGGLRTRLWTRFLSLRTGWIAVLAVAPLAALGMTIRADDMAARQRKLQREVVMPDANAMLYDFDKRQGIRAGIVTDYLAAPWLPGLERRFVMCSPASDAAFRKIYRRPDIGFALLHKTQTAPETWQFLAADGAGKSRLIGQSSAYCFYQKIATEGKSPIADARRPATASGKKCEDRTWMSRR